MDVASASALEKAMGVTIGLMAVELLVRSAFNLSLAVVVFGHILH